MEEEDDCHHLNLVVDDEYEVGGYNDNNCCEYLHMAGNIKGRRDVKNIYNDNENNYNVNAEAHGNSCSETVAYFRRSEVRLVSHAHFVCLRRRR